MHKETFFDLMPGGGAQWSADLIGPSGRLTRLCKGGAKEPDDPPPVTAPYRQDIEADAEVSRLASRKKGIQKTILAQEAAAAAAAGNMQTLGRPTQLGVTNPILTPANGGEG